VKAFTTILGRNDEVMSEWSAIRKESTLAAVDRQPELGLCEVMPEQSGKGSPVELSENL